MSNVPSYLTFIRHSEILVQILYAGRNHWVCAAFKTDTVTIRDNFGAHRIFQILPKQYLNEYRRKEEPSDVHCPLVRHQRMTLTCGPLGLPRFLPNRKLNACHGGANTMPHKTESFGRVHDIECDKEFLKIKATKYGKKICFLHAKLGALITRRKSKFVRIKA